MESTSREAKQGASPRPGNPQVARLTSSKIPPRPPKSPITFGYSQKHSHLPGVENSHGDALLISQTGSDLSPPRSLHMVNEPFHQMGHVGGISISSHAGRMVFSSPGNVKSCGAKEQPFAQTSLNVLPPIPLKLTEKPGSTEGEGSTSSGQLSPKEYHSASQIQTASQSSARVSGDEAAAAANTNLLIELKDTKFRNGLEPTKLNPKRIQKLYSFEAVLLANRVSSRKLREKKERARSDLESKVMDLEAEIGELKLKIAARREAKESLEKENERLREKINNLRDIGNVQMEEERMLRMERNRLSSNIEIKTQQELHRRQTKVMEPATYQQTMNGMHPFGQAYNPTKIQPQPDNYMKALDPRPGTNILTEIQPQPSLVIPMHPQAAYPETRAEPLVPNLQAISLGNPVKGPKELNPCDSNAMMLQFRRSKLAKTAPTQRKE